MFVFYSMHNITKHSLIPYYTFKIINFYANINIIVELKLDNAQMLRNISLLKQNICYLKFSIPIWINKIMNVI